MVLNEHRGFVWGVDGDEIIVALRHAGKVRCANPDKRFDTGDRVCLIFDSMNRNVLQIYAETDADHAVRCGIDPYYAAYCRELEQLPQNEEEVLDDIDCRESDDVWGIV